VATGIETSFGSINRSDSTVVSVLQKGAGFLCVAEVTYSPSLAFWIFFVAGLFAYVLFWWPPIIFYVIQRNTVRTAITDVFTRVKNEFELDVALNRRDTSDLETASALQEKENEAASCPGYCQDCGNLLLRDARFCEHCGAAIGTFSREIVASSGGGGQFISHSRAPTVSGVTPLTTTQGVLIAFGLFIGLSIFGGIVANFLGSAGAAITLNALLILGSSVWAGIDSARIRLRDYDSALAAHPITLVLKMLILWVVFFPAYLVARSRILGGQTELWDGLHPS